MSSIWGKNIRISVFGESHSKAIGVTIHGLPAGFSVDLDEVREAMARRAAKKAAYSTARGEKDVFEIVSGFFEGKTTGSPLTALIFNADTRSQDYAQLAQKPRPSHADYVSYIKYHGAADYRGGGHFSGRLTAPLVFAGALCDQILHKQGIVTCSVIRSIGELTDPNVGSKEEMLALRQKQFPVITDEIGEKMLTYIQEIKRSGDSVGGVIETCVYGLPVGLGDPMLEPAESVISSLLFAVPAVKGVEFGSGFDIARMRGSVANDALVMQAGEVRCKTNHNGGITGGITNGMPLVVRTAIKPTPSIALEQDTIDLTTRENTKLVIHGRHDACIVPRAVEAVRCAVAAAVLDLWLERKKYE